MITNLITIAVLGSTSRLRFQADNGKNCEIVNDGGKLVSTCAIESPGGSSGTTGGGSQMEGALAKVLKKLTEEELEKVKINAFDLRNHVLTQQISASTLTMQQGPPGEDGADGPAG